MTKFSLVDQRLTELNNQVFWSSAEEAEWAALMSCKYGNEPIYAIDAFVKRWAHSAQCHKHWHPYSSLSDCKGC